MAIDTEEKKKPLPERLGDQLGRLGDQIQGSQAWNSIFRPGSIFRKVTPTVPATGPTWS